MTTVLRATDPAGLLALVPSLAGFTPSESLVLLPFQGNRTRGAMRIDLPATSVPLTDYAKGALGVLARVPHADAVTIVVYTGASPTEGSGTPRLPHADLIRSLRAEAAARGLPIIDALCVTPAGWADYSAAPPRLRPLSEIPSAPRVPGLGDLSGDQASGADLPAVDAQERARVARALAAMERGGPRCSSPAPLPTAAIMPFATKEDIPAFLESLIESPENPTPADTAALLWCLNRPVLRDVALIHWARGAEQGRRALDAQLDLHATDAPAVDGAGALLLGIGPRPDPDRLRLALVVLRAVAARAPEPARDGVLALAAWMSWALGRTTHAFRYLELLRPQEPEHRLGRILRQLIDAAVLPEWVFDPGGPSRRQRRRGIRVPSRTVAIVERAPTARRP